MILSRLYWSKWNKFRVCLLISLFFCALFKYLRCRDDYVPKHLNKYIQFGENYSSSSPLRLRELYDKLEKLNGAREVQNWEAFGPVQADTPVLAVRVGRDAERLQYLIVSLAQVDNIRSAIVIFSHSFYDESVNQLIEGITFCMVMQIYFPYSLQLFPNVFPGVEPSNRCSYANEEAGRFCQERDAHLAEVKHHWWWMAHIVFEDVAWAHIHDGMVIFLEENDYVLPDFMHMLRYAQSSLSYVPEVQVLAFGRPLAKGLDHNKLMVDSWRPPYDKGLTFNKTVWNKIKNQSDHFCEYDDVSWSYSLLHAVEESRQGRVLMVACMAPRVISTAIFKSGRHALENIYSLTRSEGLFPANVETVMLFGPDGRVYRRFEAAMGNGGWSDERDLLLCKDPLWFFETEDYYSTTLPYFTTK